MRIKIVGMFNLRMIAALLSIFFVWNPINAQQANPEFNVVDLEIIADGKILGKPQFIMEIGSTAVAEYAKLDGYSLKVDLNKSRGAASKTRRVNVELYIAENDKWTMSAKPQVDTVLREPSELSFRSRTGKNIRIKLMVNDSFKPTAGVVYGKNKCTAARLAIWKEELSRSVSFSMMKAAQQNSTEKCCEVCRGYKCCSTGRVCCSDGYLCAGQSCCTS